MSSADFQKLLRGEIDSQEYVRRLKPQVDANFKQAWWSRVLCRIGIHDWRNMDGVCCECGFRD